MTNYATSTRSKLRAWMSNNPLNELGPGFLALAEDVDQKMVSWSEGTHAARPAAGQPNRLYFETDTGLLLRDTGAGWTGLAVPPVWVGLTLAGRVVARAETQPPGARLEVSGARAFLRGSLEATSEVKNGEEIFSLPAGIVPPALERCYVYLATGSIVQTLLNVAATGVCTLSSNAPGGSAIFLAGANFNVT